MAVYHDLKMKNHWTRQDIETLKELQQRIKEESYSLYKTAWENKVEKLNRIHKDAEKFWKGIGSMMGNAKEVSDYIIDQENNNERIYRDEDQEEVFRRIWGNIFNIPDNINVQFNQDNEEMVMNYLRENTGNMEPYRVADRSRLDARDPLTRPVTANEIKCIIKGFKNRAPGISGISRIILMNLPNNTIGRFSSLTNIILSMGYYTKEFKNGLLVFAHKPGKDPKNPESYRPITFLEVPGKIIERIVNNRLTMYCENNNKFHPNQFGFHKGKGTESAIAIAYESIAINQRDKMFCNVICRDVSKAFDRVWIEGLQYKIMHTDIPDILKRILCNYPVGRAVQIKIGNFIGEMFNLLAGVPQGSILSPSLFIFYTSNLPQPINENCRDVLFADDVNQVVEYRGDDKEELTIRTEQKIVRVNNFEKLWKIQTNRNKFKMISVSKTHPAPIAVDDNNLNFTTDVNILGLTLSRTGCKKHVTAKINSAKAQLLKLRRFYKLRPELIVRLYLTLVRPILEYPPIPISRTNMVTMQVLQNRALKMGVNGTPDQQKTIRELHEQFNVETINLRLYNRLQKSWNKIEELDPDLYAVSGQTAREGGRDHYWWPSVGKT